VDATSGLWSAAAPGWTVTVVNPDGAPSEARDAPPADRAAPDVALVAAAREGSREAFDVIVERHRRAVYNVCYRFAGNHEDASDLAQDVFVRAYRGLGGFRGDAAVTTWLYRIAVNVCLNRAAVKRPLHEPLDGRQFVDARAEAPDRLVLREQRSAQVRSALQRLPPKQRLTVVLRTYHDLTHEQIASMLGTSVGTAKANFFHALRKLRGMLGSAEDL
jgi:RNA polymerase sigma-70 factor, ECF subfamily